MQDTKMLKTDDITFFTTVMLGISYARPGYSLNCDITKTSYSFVCIVQA